MHPDKDLRGTFVHTEPGPLYLRVTLSGGELSVFEMGVGAQAWIYDPILQGFETVKRLEVTSAGRYRFGVRTAFENPLFASDDEFHAWVTANFAPPPGWVLHEAVEVNSWANPDARGHFCVVVPLAVDA